MPGHYYEIDVADWQPPPKADRLSAAVALGCAAALLLIVATHAQGSQQAWVTTSHRVASLEVVPSVVASRHAQRSSETAAATPFQAVAATEDSINPVLLNEQPFKTSQSGGGQGSTILCFGALAALAYAAFWKVSPVVAVASFFSKKEDATNNSRQLVRNTPSEFTRIQGIDEVAAAIRADQQSRKDLTPKDVILDLQRGNGRFWMGLSERPDMSNLERRALIMAQAPKVAVLSCSDSRVPVELIFDQGLGEIFVVRMAGNVLNDNAQGSLEFAVLALGCKVVMVIGHEACGAVKGACSMSAADIAKEPADLQVVLKGIKIGLDLSDIDDISDTRAREREAIVRNTSNQVKKLRQNSVFAKRIEDGSLMVCGAFYEISSGIVDFFSLDKNGLVIDL